MKFVHAADIHLGRRRLEGRLPHADFARAFHFIADQAIAGNADAFVLAGDLFDRPQVEPPHLRQAQEVLGKLKSAGIPVLAVAGNHDKAFLNSDEPTWLEFLADDGFLILLAPKFGPDGAQLDPWNVETRRGAWIDLGGVRFAGAGYLGAATPHKVRALVERLEPNRATVLLLHAGPDYFVGEGGGFSREDLKSIRERVSYLALGHIHKPMLHDGWACNPGSPENCELAEAQYDRDSSGKAVPRGYCWVELEPQSAQPLRKVEICANPRRPVCHLALDCTPYGNKLKDGAVSIERAAIKSIGDASVPSEAAVFLRLTGQVNLGRVALDLPVAAQNIERAAGVAAVCLDASGINLENSAALLESSASGLRRDEVEQAAIRKLVNDDQLWGLDAGRLEAADLFFSLKEGVRSGKSAEELAEQIQLSPLVEKVRLAAAPPSVKVETAPQNSAPGL